MDYLLDTSFLIGLWRQRAKGPEAAFLAAQSEAVLALPWIAKAEFLCGAVAADHDLERVAAFLADFPIIWPDENTLLRYARLFSRLREQQRRVGPNDLWIAAAAMEHNLPLLTRNIKELERVEGLSVVNYTA